MNLYCLVEGRRTEKKVYRSWINHVFPFLSEADRIEDVIGNNFYIISGNGYPSYISRIQASLQDIVHHGQFDKFLICIDAEQFSVADKRKEILDLMDSDSLFEGTNIIIHNCCIESWLLGHTKMLRRHPHSETLIQFKEFFDVSKQNPEDMDCPPEYDTRAQFHFQYLKEMLFERGMSYTKNNPGVVQNKDYLRALVIRYERTGHLATFGELVELWREWNGQI